MKNKNEKKSGIPMAIIGLVLLVVVVGGAWYYSTMKTTTTPKANANVANAAKTPGIPVNAPVGAQPPHLAGSPTASVTIEEFADFQCGSCAAAHPTMNEIKAMYGSRIRFIFRHYPLAIAAHDKSYDAAVTAEAAGMQGKFWDMQNLLFTNQQAWSANPNYKQTWNEYAQKIGLDMAKFQDDVIGLAAKGRVNADMERGRALSVSSTPTIFLNGISVPFKDVTVSGMKALVDAELQRTSSANQTAAPKPEANQPSNK